MNDRSALQLAVAHMARSAPQSWEQFLAAYRVYNNDVLKQVLSSPPESLQVAQGRAKQSDEFLRVLESSLGVAEQIEKRK
jgi:hypothetical protein